VNVGVVMVTFNSARHLPSSIGPLCGRYPVQVVDNASTDDSVAVARELGASVLRLPRNTGFGSGANVGVSALPADVDAVLFLNPPIHQEPHAGTELAAVQDADT
jgi:GT2 family glycosyltransferase